MRRFRAPFGASARQPSDLKNCRQVHHEVSAGFAGSRVRSLRRWFSAPQRAIPRCPLAPEPLTIWCFNALAIRGRRRRAVDSTALETALQRLSDALGVAYPRPLINATAHTASAQTPFVSRPHDGWAFLGAPVLLPMRLSSHPSFRLSYPSHASIAKVGLYGTSWPRPLMIPRPISLITFTELEIISNINPLIATQGQGDSLLYRDTIRRL